MASLKQAKQNYRKANKYILYCKGLSFGHSATDLPSVTDVVLDVYANSAEEAIETAYEDVAANVDNFYDYQAIIVEEVHPINSYKPPQKYQGA